MKDSPEPESTRTFTLVPPTVAPTKNGRDVGRAIARVEHSNILAVNISCGDGVGEGGGVRVERTEAVNNAGMTGKHGIATCCCSWCRICARLSKT